MSSGIAEDRVGNPLSFWLCGPKKARVKLTCRNCYITSKRFGKDRKGYQRFRCPKCGRTVPESHNGIVRGTYTPIEKAESVLRLLVEGNSIRSIERITGMHKGSACSILCLIQLLPRSHDFESYPGNGARDYGSRLVNRRATCSNTVLGHPHCLSLDIIGNFE